MLLFSLYYDLARSSGKGSTQLLSSLEGLLPSYDVGTNYVPYDQIAQIHKGERILTADENRHFTKTFGKKNTANNNNYDIMINTLGVKLDNMNQHLEKLERNIDNVTRGNSLQVRNAS
jgi:hypothetical protein